MMQNLALFAAAVFTPAAGNTGACVLLEPHEVEAEMRHTLASRTNVSYDALMSRDTALPYGPYEVKTGTIANMPGLTKGGPYSAHVIYAVQKHDKEYLPFISFAHGTTAGGAKTYTDYVVDLSLVASYGFVIVAPDSCPTIECFSGYASDQLATIDSCFKNSGQPGKGKALHPSLVYADFAHIGIYGHSMGGMATMKSAEYAKQYTISAAVAQHPCRDIYEKPGDIACPIMYTAGTADTICADGCSKTFYEQTSVSKAGSKILFDVAGASHFEPTSTGKNSEVPAVAFFLTCHLRNENCDKVYGADGKAICKQIYAGDTLGDCQVEGGKSRDVVV